MNAEARELEPIQNKIYEIRDRKVMLDFDLAEMYGVPTKALKQSVKRNIRRFPPDFMFELTKSEWIELVTNCDHIPENMKHSHILPSAFSEHGVTMISSVLRSDAAISISIQIVRAFVSMRHLILNSPVNKMSELQTEVRELKEYIEEVFTDYNDINEDTRIQLDLINQTLSELQVKDKQLSRQRNPIGYNSERYK